MKESEKAKIRNKKIKRAHGLWRDQLNRYLGIGSSDKQFGVV